MKKDKKTAANKGDNKQPNTLKQLRNALTQGFSAESVKRVTMSVNTHIATRVDNIGIDSFALDVLEKTTPEWVPAKLQKEMKESLRGFSEWAALWIAESLTDACRGEALATTGIPHIDSMLWTLYAKILNCARQIGVKIANHV